MRCTAVIKSLVLILVASPLGAQTGSSETPTPASGAASLVAACREAKADFHPISQSDVAQDKEVLLAAIQRLDARLSEAGPNGDAWRKYLLWDAMPAAIDQPDSGKFWKIYDRYTADHDGLDLVWFVDVREALRRYEAISRAVHNPKVREAHATVLDRLAAALESHQAKPTPETMTVIYEYVRWLREAHQSPKLVAAILQHFDRPNFLASVSTRFIAAGIAAPVDDVAEITDCILGTSVFAKAHTVGETRVQLQPNAEMGVIDTLLLGTTTGESVGYHGPVTIFSNSITKLSGLKRMCITDEGLSAQPAVSNAETSVNICDIQSNKGRRIIEQMAWRRAGKQQSEAEAIASRHAEQRLNERIDAQADEQIEKANDQYVNKFRQPFSDRKLFPQLLRFGTSETLLSVTGRQAEQGELAAASASPPVADGDVVLRLHESAVNNLAYEALAGRTIHEEKVQATATDLLGHLPEKMKGDDDGRPWAISFNRRDSISVSFADGGFKIVIHGDRFYKGKEGYPKMNISVVYKIVQSPAGFKAVRQGEIEVFPPDFVPGSGQRIDARQTVIRNLLKRRLEKVFEPEMLGKGIELSGKWKAAGKLMPIEVVARDGWLVIAWKLTPPEPKAAAVQTAQR
jgi:hypothetical protein